MRKWDRKVRPKITLPRGYGSVDQALKDHSAYFTSIEDSLTRKIFM
ncbi:hypothetical protein BAXH7_01291 [Bacillus amyloliquefaciens XH7]|nr:hypothetical protein BAXH7_01291 [Bacillus amyloliquefaciens XH7]